MNPQGRYLLLIADQYYPSGWDDFAGRFDSFDEAYNEWVSKRDTLQCYWIVDLNTNQIQDSGYWDEVKVSL